MPLYPHRRVFGHREHRFRSDSQPQGSLPLRSRELVVKLTSSLLLIILASVSVIRSEAVIESFKYEPFVVAPDPVEEFLPFGTGIGRSFAFANHQDGAYGSRVRFVNTSLGNLTFEWRDIVLPGALAFHVGRIYDSEWVEARGGAGLFASADFGPGWRLRPGDFILESLDGSDLTLYPDNGTKIEFKRVSGGAFRLRLEGPGPWQEIVPGESGTLLARLPAGVIKTFSTGTLVGLYLLQEIRDANGNWLRLSWRNDRLQRVENSAGAFVEVVREAGRNFPSERVVAIQDSAGRTVHFRYDRGGQLVESAAPGEIRTAFTYDSAGRLSSVFDGAGRLLFGASYNKEGQVDRFRRSSGDIKFRYDPSLGVTTVRSALGNEARFFHDGAGAHLADRRSPRL